MRWVQLLFLSVLLCVGFAGCDGSQAEKQPSTSSVFEASVIFSLLGSRASKGHFVRGERAWLTYRRAACGSRADVYEGGSAAGIVFLECAVDRNLAHLKELRTFERDLRPK